METYDVIVIGSGQGGNPFALESAGRGKKTALIEMGPIGGTCINTGCTPTKTMIASGRIAYLARRGAEYGVNTGKVRIEMDVVRARKRAMVADFSGSSEKEDLATHNLTLIREIASFTGAKTLKAGSHELTADIIVLDTGCKPFIPPLPGLAQIPYLDNASVMELDEVPEHLLVLGGGPIGTEFAQLFRRLGSKVTLIERADRFMPREDADVADALAAILTEDGIEIRLGTTASSVGSDKGGHVRVDLEADGKEKSVEGSHLLVALGRTPNVEMLHLDKAGIETMPRGWIKVNDRLETSVPGVFAIGDVNGGPQFTHISYDDFRILRDNLFKHGSRSTSDRLVPYVIFTDPQLGRVGLSEHEAIQKGISHKVFNMQMSSIARALETGESRGVIKVVVDPDTKKILGAAVLGLEGGEIMNMIQIAMMGGLPYTALRDGVFAHPTLGEGLNNLFQA